MEMSEQARVRNTFKGYDPLLFQLFGDIFEHDDHLVYVPFLALKYPASDILHRAALSHPLEVTTTKIA